MPSENSVSRWLEGLRKGNDADVERLWDRYFQRLVRVASGRMPGHARRASDEEDIALSAFHSFCDRVGRGQFPSSSTATISGVSWSPSRRGRSSNPCGVKLARSAAADVCRASRRL